MISCKLQTILVQVFKLREDKRQEHMKAAFDKRQTFQQKVWLHISCMQQGIAEVLSWPVHTIQYAVVV